MAETKKLQGTSKHTVYIVMGIAIIMATGLLRYGIIQSLISIGIVYAINYKIIDKIKKVIPNDHNNIYVTLIVFAILAFIINCFLSGYIFTIIIWGIYARICLGVYYHGLFR